MRQVLGPLFVADLVSSIPIAALVRVDDPQHLGRSDFAFGFLRNACQSNSGTGF